MRQVDQEMQKLKPQAIIRLPDFVKPTEAPPKAADQPKPKPKKPKIEDDSLDYSHLYSCFNDIFVGHQTDPKQFDLNYAMRETRNIYASFVGLMEGAH